MLALRCRAPPCPQRCPRLPGTTTTRCRQPEQRSAFPNSQTSVTDAATRPAAAVPQVSNAIRNERNALTAPDSALPRAPTVKHRRLRGLCESGGVPQSTSFRRHRQADLPPRAFPKCQMATTVRAPSVKRAPNSRPLEAAAGVADPSRCSSTINMRSTTVVLPFEGCWPSGALAPFVPRHRREGGPSWGSAGRGFQWPSPSSL